MQLLTVELMKIEIVPKKIISEIKDTTVPRRSF